MTRHSAIELSMSAAARAERRRQEILEAALEVFAEKGFHAAGIADIAQVLGMGHGTFYRYFRNKRDIFQALTLRVMARITAVLQNEPPTTDSLADYEAQLQRIASGLFSVFAQEPKLGRVVLFEVAAVDPALHEQFQQALSLVAGFTRGYLENGIRKGFLRADMDSRIIARAINAVIFEGMREVSLSKDPEQEANRWITQGVTQMLYGVASKT